MNSRDEAEAVVTDRPCTMGVARVGMAVGLPGATEGRGVAGSGEGSGDGTMLGESVGGSVGAGVGSNVGSIDGARVGS